MKHLKTFESYNQLNEEELFESDVYKFLLDAKDKEIAMGLIPKFIEQAKRYGSYTNEHTEKLVDLKDLTDEDYKNAVELGENNKWGSPGRLLGTPKFLKEAEPKLRKAYEYIYQMIDKLNQGQSAHTGGSGG
jgi:hypothetical protein